MIAHGWLALWLLVTWTCVGGIAWTAIGQLTGGGWVDASAPDRQAQRRLLPLAAMLGLPLLIAANHVFPWMDQPVDAARRWYLSYPFMAARTVAVFLAWGSAWSLARRLPAASLILWLFADGIFATDWIVSLDPAWRSSAIGLIAATGQLSVAMANLALRTSAYATRSRADIAALLIALCLGWSYLAGIDYLTAWMADQAYETHWYLPRVQGGWGLLALAAIALHLIIPCTLLLTRQRRERAATLALAGASVLLGEACYLAWLVLP